MSKSDFEQACSLPVDRDVYHLFVIEMRYTFFCENSRT